MIGAVPTPPGPRCVVVGAGLLGLSAAWSLSRRGADVLVVEAATPGHARGGSSGQARIFRLGYPDPLYVQLARRAQALWATLEAEHGSTLCQVTGQLTFGPQMAAIATALTAGGGPFEALSMAEAARRFPGVRTGGPALFEADSGVLRADQVLRALVATGSFELRTGAPVQQVEDGAGGATVVLAGGQRLPADVVVNCAGHHALALLPAGVAVPVRRPPTRQQVAYLALPPGQAIPVFIEWGPDMVYGLPVPGAGLYKLAQHLPGPPLTSDDDPLDDDPALVGTLLAAARRLLPGLVPEPVATERCPYDNTADSDFILDRVGHVVVGCGTSGHGFKFGPLLGELLADLALGTPPPVDPSRFALQRPGPAL
jgi:sarcosine oxidase